MLERFDSIEDALIYCQRFFGRSNHDRRHGGIGLMAPAAVHYDDAATLAAQPAVTLKAAFDAHPARFKGRVPQQPILPVAASINPPKQERPNASTTLHQHKSLDPMSLEVIDALLEGGDGETVGTYSRQRKYSR